MREETGFPRVERAEPDVLGDGYTSETIHLPDDAEGPVVATVVTRASAVPTKRAVLHVHGFADYFFQTEYAEWWTERGYTFYAVDLRKYGRSIRSHQTPNYVEDLSEYHAELDAALDMITRRDGHDVVVGSAHSTGGLVLPLWNAARDEPLTAMVLNAPWFDLRGPWLMRSVGTTVIHRVARQNPRRVIPRSVSGYYARSLHADHEGEWHFNLDWKPMKSWPVYAGWLSAVREGHRTLHRGLCLSGPVLVLASDRTTLPARMDEDVHTSDIVLDVDQIRRWAPTVSQHVTTVAIPRARHDVVLSRPEVRARAYAELDRWVSTYVEG